MDRPKQWLGFFLIYVVLLLSPAAMAAGLLGDVIQQVDRAVLDVGKKVDRAHQEIKTPVIEYQRLKQESANRRLPADTLRLIQEAQMKMDEREREVSRSISEAETQLTEVNRKLSELKVLSEAIEAEKQKLQTEKAEIARREQLFSMGFYTSLATTVLALFGLFVRLPTARLEAKLKTLEIEHKEFELAQLKQISA